MIKKYQSDYFNKGKIIFLNLATNNATDNVAFYHSNISRIILHNNFLILLKGSKILFGLNFKSHYQRKYPFFSIQCFKNFKITEI